jgi:hypothetical protein
MTSRLSPPNVSKLEKVLPVSARRGGTLPPEPSKVLQYLARDPCGCEGRPGLSGSGLRHFVLHPGCPASCMLECNFEVRLSSQAVAACVREYTKGLAF